jgi:Trk K+ transport system NAD-binding subunit
LARLAFMVSVWGIVDLLALLPFYLPMVLDADLRFVRILRVFRILRLLKTGRYAASVGAIGRVLRQTREQLATTLCLILLLIVLSSSVIYYAEHEAQPEAFGSIPSSLWWGMATLTTVGYGDVYPVTPLGKVFASFIALAGIGVVALPSGILASGLIEEFEQTRRGERMERDLKNHVLVCGWNSLADEILRNLVTDPIRRAGIESIVVLADLPERPQALDKYEQRVVFVRGDACKEADLRRVRAQECHTALILSNLTSPQADAETLLSALTVQSLNKDIYVCAQVKDSANKRHFENIEVEEIVCIEDISAGLSVGSAVNHGLARLVGELLAFNQGNAIYSMPVPDALVGRSFGELSVEFLGKGAILIGLQRADAPREAPLVNPDRHLSIEQNDRLFLISREHPSG